MFFSDPTAHWQKERRRIQAETEKENTEAEAERPSAAEPKFNNNIPKEKKVEPVYSIPNKEKNIPNKGNMEPVYSMPSKEKEKIVKHVHLEEEVEVIPIQSSGHQDKSEKLVMETATDGE